MGCPPVREVNPRALAIHSIIPHTSKVCKLIYVHILVDYALTTIFTRETSFNYISRQELALDFALDYIEDCFNISL